MSDLTFNTTTVVSEELDFDIPRGFVVKIHEIEFDIRGIQDDIDAIVNGQWEMVVALIRDPDDTTTIGVPANSVQHDVVDDFDVQVVVDATSTQGNAFITTIFKQNKVPEHVDIITARNMRFNIAGAGQDVANLTEAQARVKVKYTLEKVTDIDILNLLDIL